MRKPYQANKFIDALLAFLRRSHLMYQKRIQELVVHNHTGVECRCGILEDHRNHTTYLFAQIGGTFGHILTFEKHATRRR